MGREKNGNSELGHAQWMREGKPEKRQQGRNKRSELGKDCGNLGWDGGLEGRVSVGKREWGGRWHPSGIYALPHASLDGQKATAGM